MQVSETFICEHYHVSQILIEGNVMKLNISTKCRGIMILSVYLTKKLLFPPFSGDCLVPLHVYSATYLLFLNHILFQMDKTCNRSDNKIGHIYFCKCVVRYYL